MCTLGPNTLRGTASLAFVTVTSISNTPIVWDVHEVNTDGLQGLVEPDPRKNTPESAGSLEVHFTIVADRLQQLSKVYKLAQWATCEITECGRRRRPEAATQLLSRRRPNNWLTSVVTGDGICRSTNSAVHTGLTKVGSLGHKQMWASTI